MKRIRILAFGLRYGTYSIITRMYAAQPGRMGINPGQPKPGPQERKDTVRYRASVIGAATCQASLVQQRHWITCKK